MVDPLCAEAADKIERLEDDVARLLNRCELLDEEVAHLRTENDQFRSQFREADEIIAEWEGHTPDAPPPGWYRVTGGAA